MSIGQKLQQAEVSHGIACVLLLNPTRQRAFLKFFRTPNLRISIFTVNIPISNHDFLVENINN